MNECLEESKLIGKNGPTEKYGGSYVHSNYLNKDLNINKRVLMSSQDSSIVYDNDNVLNKL